MIIYGRNPVIEALSKTPPEVEELLILKEWKGERVSGLIRIAKEKGIKFSFLPREALSKISGTSNHQGIAAKISEFEYKDVREILNRAGEKGEKLLAVILDHIEDPQNLGAIIRTVNVLGAHGVIIPKDRAAGVTPSVVKSSAGATGFVSVARVVNLVAAIKDLKNQGVWIAGADAEAPKTIFQEDFGKLDIALVIGNEGRGLTRLVKEQCDFLVAIPNVGEVSSLNASVAAGIIIYEVVRQRGKINV